MIATPPNQAFVAARGRIPSRGDNPFATCWTRPGALPFISAPGCGLQQIEQSWPSLRESQVVGPHGSGKSTLVERLLARVPSGLPVARWTLDGSGGTPGGAGDIPRGGLLVVDGFEQIAPVARWRVRRRVKRRGARLLVTTHRRLGRWGFSPLPVLAELSPSVATALELFDTLTGSRPTPVPRSAVAESYHRCRGNLREVWFALYDLHEEAMSRR